MPLQKFTCPSGLIVNIRGLRASEIDLFANKQEVATRMVGTRILEACVESVEWAGPLYDGLDPSAPGFWDKVYTCDRFAALLGIRIATHGSAYVFKTRCTSSTCDRPFEWELDLSTLERFDMPPDTVQALTNGQNLHVTLADGSAVEFTMLDGAGERDIASRVEKNPRSRVSTGIARRIKAVHTGDRDLVQTHEIASWVVRLPFGDMMDLLDSMDSMDGGYQTNIDVMCPHCGNEMAVDIPFDEGFWVKTRTSSSRRSRGSR